MAEHQVLFCPFCRESFEGQRVCPEHELALVPFDRLEPDPLDDQQQVAVDLDTAVESFDPRYGRGWVALGALGTAVALGLDMGHFPDERAVPAFMVATWLPSLWTLGLASFTLFFLLHRRRTLRALQSLRVLVPVLSAVAPGTMLWALHRISRGEAFLFQSQRQFHIGAAVYVVFCSALFVALGGARLGVPPDQTAKRPR